MKPNQLTKIVIQGFKSIKKCDLELKNLNILIGPNGAGKSNFIQFFQMIRQISQSNLKGYVDDQKSIDSLLYFGQKKTEQLSVELYYGEKEYKFTLEPIHDRHMMFANESYNKGSKEVSQQKDRVFELFGSGHIETFIKQNQEFFKAENSIQAIKSWRVYHFNDTSEDAKIKQPHKINDNIYLLEDGRNLAAFLYILKKKHEIHYQRIIKTIRLVAPFFGDFFLKPTPLNTDEIELEWTEKGEDAPFNAHYLSDGTLRFICLATVLLQPENFQPETILIDEPELGLHPYAINVLAGLLRSASKTRQIIVSTQSVEFLNEFNLEDVIVADRTKDGTYLHRLNVDELKSWLEEYSLGELWKTNLMGGRP
jgi:predicted ATPase